MTYDRLRTDELRGTTQAEYLIALDADFRIVDGGETRFEEPSFPVVELARSLLMWLADSPSTEFEFDSMSYEEAGLISIRRVSAGWTIVPIFDPHAKTTPAELGEVHACCRRLIARVEADLEALGLNPGVVLRR